MGVEGFVVARRERGEEAGAVSLSLSFLDDDEGRRKRDAKRLCLAGGVCDCMSGWRAVDGCRETAGMAARRAGEFAGSCRVQRCTYNYQTGVARVMLAARLRLEQYLSRTSTASDLVFRASRPATLPVRR